MSNTFPEYDELFFQRAFQHCNMSDGPTYYEACQVMFDLDAKRLLAHGCSEAQVENFLKPYKSQNPNESHKLKLTDPELVDVLVNELKHRPINATCEEVKNYVRVLIIQYALNRE